MGRHHKESHRSGRAGWLRASVLGANDGIVSTASLMVGVAASDAAGHMVMLAGLAGLVGGALSMAAGEYISVSSQADSERADIDQERKELERHPETELSELTGIYVKRGLDPALAAQVARQLSANDVLDAHARDELGITGQMRARPLQAALASAAAFSIGAALPLLTTALAPAPQLVAILVVVCLASLALLGAAAARIGGASMRTGAIRVTLWSALALATTAMVGRWFGAGG